MALAKFKTKQPVEIDAMTGTSSIVYMEIDSVSVSDNGYTSNNTYRIDNGQGRRIIKKDSRTFNRIQAVQLFNLLGASGGNFDEQLFSLIPKVCLYRLGVAGYWGLTSNDWEVDNAT